MKTEVEIYRKRGNLQGITGWTVVSIDADSESTSTTTPLEIFENFQNDASEGFVVYDPFVNEEIRISSSDIAKALKGKKHTPLTSLSVKLIFLPDPEFRKKPSEMVDWLRKTGKTEEEIEELIKWERSLNLDKK
jgi:hypothetical protein